VYDERKVAAHVSPPRTPTDDEPMTHSHATASAMREAAGTLLAALRPEQLTSATAPFDTPDHRSWTYLPGSRPGLSLREMDDAQRGLAMTLLGTGLSGQGMTTAGDIMALEAVLAELERSTGKPGWERRHPGHFWVRVLGVPDRRTPWAWRVNGHHLAVHLTVVGDQVASTPQFFGANPAVVPRGPHQGRRTLPVEEDLARDLVGLLDGEQRSVAVVDPVAPDDIATRRDPVADPEVVARGLAHGDMDRTQRRAFERLLRHYVDRVTPALAGPAWRAMSGPELPATTFAWAGDLARGAAHYYAVRGATFLLEYDNVQDGANHIHTVWRDLRSDWGGDLLAAHHTGLL
jgi:hypothetical protein